MRCPWGLLGGAGGFVIGGTVGCGVPLVAMSLGPSHSDGTDGMREMLVCLPIGALVGLLGGTFWGLNRRPSLRAEGEGTQEPQR